MTITLDVVVPVLNEEQDLAPNIGTLHRFLSGHFETWEWRIVIADNGSTDSTPAVSKRLTEEYREVAYVRLDQRGRGRALRKTWLESQSDIVGYMDVDLSTDLAAFPELVEAVSTGGYDVAIGSRLAKGARVIGRPLRRELISRAYSFIFRAMFYRALLFGVGSSAGFRDAQCGFKALSRRVATEVVPLVEDTGWFFDTELLILADKNGFRIKEVPVEWTDDPDTRVRIISTAYHDMAGLLRLKLGGLKKASARLSMGKRSR